MESAAARTRKITAILEDFMGLREDRFKQGDPLEQLVITILSQNTTDANCHRAFENLCRKFSDESGKPDWHRIAHAPVETVADAIRTGGLANQKSCRIQDILQWIYREHGDYNIDFIHDMTSEDAIRYFISQKGIGIKTISIVLCFSCGRDIFPVDTHVNRICQRLGLVDKKSSAEKTFYAMQEKIPPGKAFSLHIHMVKFGRQVCRARNPECGECPLAGECRYYREEIRGESEKQTGADG